LRITALEAPLVQPIDCLDLWIASEVKDPPVATPGADKAAAAAAEASSHAHQAAAPSGTAACWQGYCASGNLSMHEEQCSQEQTYVTEQDSAGADDNTVPDDAAAAAPQGTANAVTTDTDDADPDDDTVCYPTPHKGSHLLPATINADDQWFEAHPEVGTCGMHEDQCSQKQTYVTEQDSAGADDNTVPDDAAAATPQGAANAVTTDTDDAAVSQEEAVYGTSPPGHEDGNGAQGKWVQQKQATGRPSPCQDSSASSQTSMHASARALIAQASDDMSAPELAAWQLAMEADNVLKQALNDSGVPTSTCHAVVRRLLERA